MGIGEMGLFRTQYSSLTATAHGCGRTRPDHRVTIMNARGQQKGSTGYLPLQERRNANQAEGTWNHETGGVGAHKRSGRYKGRTGLTAVTSKTESERQQAKKSNAEVILCKGVHT